MRYELSIDSEYLSGANGWDAAAGLRELMQNGRDAEIEHGARLSITYHNSTLRIENDGTVLSRDVLLLGRSTKRGRVELAGQFGEGLKLGVLVLVRSGYAVKIRTGSEVWVPNLEASERFEGRKVLVFRVETGREYKNRVRIEVGPIKPEVWQQLPDRFLFMSKTAPEGVKTPAGTLLTSERHAGSVYVKGILVQRHEDLACGYDFPNVTLDRDRRLIASWDLQYYTREVWRHALEQQPGMVMPFLNLLGTDAEDVKGINTYNAEMLPPDVVKTAVAEFKAQHGTNAVPVKTLGDSKDVEHLGVTGVVVPEALGAVLGVELGTVTGVKERLAKEVVKQYGWHELDITERSVLDTCIELVCKTRAAAGVALWDLVDVVDFRSLNLMGQYRDGRILLARKYLKDRKTTLATLIHELAHRAGGDGDHGHVAAMEAIWGDVTELLWDAVRATENS